MLKYSNPILLMFPLKNLYIIKNGDKNIYLLISNQYYGDHDNAK